MDPFLLIGILVILGFLGARVSDRFRVPWVVGYILVGVLLGTSGIGLIGPAVVEQLDFVSAFALGLIGVTIGSELKVAELRSLGRSIFAITILEASAAFVLVGVSIYLLTRNIALALVFGALASATAPAATVDVLWQYHSRGPLTSTLFAVVGLDDAAALIIYAFASSLARVFVGSAEFSASTAILEPLMEIGGSLVLGGLLGWGLHLVFRRVKEEAHSFVLMVGTLILAVGVSNWLGFSLILTSMAIGVTLINLSRGHRGVFDRLATLNPIVFLLFFVLVGARVDVRLIGQLGGIGLAYLVMRVVGKTSGAYVGARISAAPETVRKYIGFGLLSQAGVAIGLAIDASHTFASYGPAGARIGTLAISVIAATTFVYQVLGPPLTKMAIFKAGEVPEEYAKA